MPRFFFDTDDGERRCRDEVGIDLADRSDVPEEAAGLLRDLVHVHLPVGRRVIAVEVQDAGRRPVYRAAMTVVGRMRE